MRADREHLAARGMSSLFLYDLSPVRVTPETIMAASGAPVQFW